MTTQRTSDDLLRIVLLVVAVLVLFPVLMLLFAVPMMGMMGSGMGGMGGSLLWGIGVFVLPLVVVLGAGYLLYRGLDGDSSTAPALEELRLAYARGDLTDEEFEQRRERLERDEE